MNEDYIKSLPKVTKAQAQAWKDAGHVVAIYPRKKLVVVDGFRKFQLKG